MEFEHVRNGVTRVLTHGNQILTTRPGVMVNVQRSGAEVTFGIMMLDAKPTDDGVYRCVSTDFSAVNAQLHLDVNTSKFLIYDL